MGKSKISQLKKELAELQAKQDRKEAAKKAKEILSHEQRWMNTAFENAGVPYETIIEPDMYGGYTVGLKVAQKPNFTYYYRQPNSRPLRFAFSSAENAAVALDIIRGTLIWMGWHTAEEIVMLENGLELEETL